MRWAYDLIILLHPLFDRDGTSHHRPRHVHGDRNDDAAAVERHRGEIRHIKDGACLACVHVPSANRGTLIRGSRVRIPIRDPFHRGAAIVRRLLAGLWDGLKGVDLSGPAEFRQINDPHTEWSCCVKLSRCGLGGLLGGWMCHLGI